MPNTSESQPNPNAMNRIGRGIKNNKSVDNLLRDKSRDKSNDRSVTRDSRHKNNIPQHTPTFNNNNMTDDFTSIWLNSKLRDRRDKRQLKYKSNPWRLDKFNNTMSD